MNDFIFSQEDRRLLNNEGFDIEKHPNNHEFAIKKGQYGGSFVICFNDEGTMSAGYDSGLDSDDLNETVKIVTTAQESIVLLSQFDEYR